MARILITGGGRLAAQISSFLPFETTTVIPHKYLDVTDPLHCRQVIRAMEADIVIHCAAVLAVEAERDHLKAWAVNVEGTRNICLAAAQNAAKVVYISSDYVFGGSPETFQRMPVRGMYGYREKDTPYPANFYGVTKRAGELIALESPNNLIIRAPFRYGPPWIYDNAFEDQVVSARWIGEAAHEIALATTSELTGILHIGGVTRTLYDMARSVNPEVKKSKRADWPGLMIPADTMLDSRVWERWKWLKS